MSPNIRKNIISSFILGKKRLKMVFEYDKSVLTKGACRLGRGIYLMVYRTAYYGILIVVH